jgi:hypothetical protein
LKCINGDRNQKLLAELQEQSAALNVTFLDRYLSSEDNQLLSNSCDAYVSLHRAEGLGLPIAEAMLNKKPVVTTGWSGNMDFTSISNSYLVSYELIANQIQVGPYKIADTWADPNSAHAAQQMRNLYNDTATRDRLVANAFRSVSDYFSRESVAQIMQTRFSAIASFNRETEDIQGDAKVCHVDALTEQRLRIIETGEDSADSNPSKSRIRKIMMNLVEKSGYLNRIYSALFRKLFVDSSKIQTKVELVDSRTRRALADADRRIAALEKRLAELEEKD